MHAYDAMIAAKQNYPHVTHTFYCQGEYKWVSMFTGQAVERKAGVCNGLCLRWIKSSNQEKWVKSLSSDATNNNHKPDRIRLSVVRIQEKSVKLNREAVLPSRRNGGFGSLAVIQFNNCNYFVYDDTYPNETGIRCYDQQMLREKVAESVAESRADYTYASLIHITPGNVSAVGHTVAVIAWKRCVLFFDPNGGILGFTSRRSFRRWFRNAFGTISNYGEAGTTLQVVNYHYVDESLLAMDR